MEGPTYDVVIMGAGVAGLCLARLCLLKYPYMKIAMIDTRNEARDNIDDLKVGESTVDISAMFLYRELGLQNYLIENHCPKFTLQYHWAKDATKSTETMDDYISFWSCKNPELQSFQLNRAKFERDVLAMNKEKGATYWRGKVKDVDVPSGDGIKSVYVELIEEDESGSSSKEHKKLKGELGVKGEDIIKKIDAGDFSSGTIMDKKYEIPTGSLAGADEGPAVTTSGKSITLKARHLVDTAGRNFILGRKFDNIVLGAENLYGVNNASVWVRVRNFDVKTFDSSYHPDRTTGSWYYCTNHFMGPGHWLWMIPIESRHGREISIGVSFHLDVIKFSELNTLEKFMAFLKTNHKVLFNLITSGEVMDFHKWPRLAHSSKTFISPDNWYVMGDAACIFDPFYSTGMVMMAFEAEAISSTIHTKLQGDKVLAARKVKVFDEFIRAITCSCNHLISHHNKHLGHAAVMSWRQFLELNFTFGVATPAYVGKWNTCPDFCEAFTKALAEAYQIREYAYNLLDEAVAKNLDMGVISQTTGTILGYQPQYMWDYDHDLSKCRYEPKRNNIFKRIAWTNFYVSAVLITIKYKVHGFKSLFEPEFLKLLGGQAQGMAFGTIMSIVHWIKHINTPDNSIIARQEKEEFTGYVCKNLKPMPWLPEQKETMM